MDTLVGLALGMGVVAGLAMLFGNASRSATELENSMRHIENARYALDLLAEDLSMAGFYGTAAVQVWAAGLSPCADSQSVARDINTTHATATPTTLPWPVQGYTSQEAAALGCLPDLQAGSSALVLRRVDTRPLTAASAPTNAVVLQASHFREDLLPLVASADGSGLVLRDRSGQANEVRRLLLRVYYVARCSECVGAGDGIPTLKRLELRPSGLVVVPLVEGIDQVAWDYGLDSSGDGVPDTWQGLSGGAGTAESTAIAAAGWSNVVAVRVSVLSRALQVSAGHQDPSTYALGLRGTTPITVGPYSDGYKRRMATATVRLQTVAGLRERP